MRIMAIDYGDAHTGIAISDPTGFLTGTTTTIHSRKAEEVAGEIARLLSTYLTIQKRSVSYVSRFFSGRRGFSVGRPIQQ